VKELVLDLGPSDRGIDLGDWVEEHRLWGVIPKRGGYECLPDSDEPEEYDNASFDDYYRQAKRLGLHVGAYYYSIATDVRTMRHNARHLVSLLDGYDLDLPVYLDMEDPAQLHLSAGARADLIEAFCDVVEGAGYIAGVYGGADALADIPKGRLRGYAMWAAAWQGKKPSWASDYGMWQQGGMNLDGDVVYDDVNGYHDFDWCYEDYLSMTGGGDDDQMCDEIDGWAETLEECRDASDYAYCTCEVYSCGYSQPNRTGISFESLRGGWAETDCSYGVATWLYWSDTLPDLYGFWTAIEVDYLVGQGFELLDADEVEPMRNDVLWRPGHTGLYIGDGMQAEALRTERHDAGYDGSIPGDQDGGETVVREYPAGGWTYILRPPCNQGIEPEPEPRPEIPDEGAGAIYRLFDSGSGAHLYTANLDEARRASSWMDYEGVAWRVSGDGQPVYRLFDERSGDHFLTTSESERDTARGWMADEGVAFVTGGDIPVHRLYDEGSGQHFYTASEHEYQAVRQWMTDEGIGFYATSERDQIAYAAHVQSIGWMAPVKAGETAGTSGKSLRLEALRIVPPRGMVIDAMAHVQGIGDVWVEGISHEGGTIGTVGESRRVEGIAIRVVNGGHLQYRCHIQRKGWTPWVDDGNYCGTRGERLRVEAVQIRFA